MKRDYITPSIKVTGFNSENIVTESTAETNYGRALSELNKKMSESGAAVTLTSVVEFNF